MPLLNVPQDIGEAINRKTLPIDSREINVTIQSNIGKGDQSSAPKSIQADVQAALDILSEGLL